MKPHILTALFLSFALAQPASAQTDVAHAEFIPGWRQADGSHVAGLLIDLSPGWKTYWRSPGDAGIPPRFDWAGSRNIASLQPVWPTPKAMDQNGMTSIGYPGDVVIPLVIRPDIASDRMALSGRIELGVCKDICVPAALSFSGELTANGTRDTRIVAALADQPLSKRAARVSAVTCSASPVRGGMALTAEITMPPAGGPEFVVIEPTNPSIWVAEAKTHRTGQKLTATTEMSHVEGAPFALDRSGLRFTVLGRDYAVDIVGCTGG